MSVCTYTSCTVLPTHLYFLSVCTRPILHLFSCSSCVSSLNCKWCPVEFDCRTSGGDCTSSPVVGGVLIFNVDVSYLQHLLLPCPLPHQSTSGSCPRFLPSNTNDGRYYLHKGLSPPDVSLILNAQNLISPVSVGMSYIMV